LQGRPRLSAGDLHYREFALSTKTTKSKEAAERRAAKKKARAEARRARLRAFRHTALPPPTQDSETPPLSLGPPHLLSKAEVLLLTGVSFPTIWSWMRANPPRFPRSRVTGEGGCSKSVWLSTDVEQWMRALPLRPLLKKQDDVDEVAA
jgi:predicted DNA-binding transcriptional regulator AlpA